MNRDAAAILLVRGAGDDLEVFLVERAPELRFFGGYHAAPGGVREQADGPDGAGGDDRPALLRCAARELHEEIGVELAPEALREVCRIRTPPFAPVRYDTLFVLGRLPDGQTPRIAPGELVGGRFVRPADALAAWRAGEILIVPPVILLLELLAHGDVEAFVRDAAALAHDYRAGRLHRVQFTPGIVLAPLRTPTLPPATTTNCLIVGRDRLLVIDPGTPHADEHERLFALLDELCAHGATLHAIVLTHHHPDHSGGVRAVQERCSMPVRGHPLTLARLPDGCRAGEPIEDGSRIALGTAPDGSDGWHLQAIFTPGHDRGHLCFRDNRYGALIAGDMISTVSTIVIDPPEGHMRTYLDSLRRLRGIEFDMLYPAHGPAVRNGRAVVERYLAHRAQRQGKLVAALAGAPASVEELLPVVYADTDARLHALAARSLLAGLQMLEEDGRARQRARRWELTPDGRRP
jgi:glyoxylase-like metal-dependent hydrolase (beta-lactamase superfamily II)/8-oxo-dGTP pyrophosphatase MutT (NUDIX family)